MQPYDSAGAGPRLAPRRFSLPRERSILDGGMDSREPEKGTRGDDEVTERVRMIRFSDARWKVSVRPLPALGGRLALVFDCAQALRIVKHFPANWYSLSDSELAALSLCV